MDHRLRENRDNPKAIKVYEKYIKNNINGGSAFIFTTKKIHIEYRSKYKLNNKIVRIIPNYILLNNWIPSFKISKEKKLLFILGDFQNKKI